MANPASQALKDPKARARLRRVIFLGAVTILLLGTCNTTYDYVPPHKVGIRESRYAGGIQKDPLPGGRWYITGPGVTLHMFPTTLQAVEFASSPSETSKDNEHVMAAGRIEIDTSDGSKMHADVTVIYRIEDAYTIMREFGPGRTYEVNALVPRAQAALKENLGRLSAEDFYNDDAREKATQSALEAMRAPLKHSGLLVEHVLIRQYYYANDYQKMIEARKVQDQLVFTQQSRAESSKEDARRRKIAAEGEAAVAVEKQRGESEIIKIRAQADLYSRKQRAEGDLLVSLATAKGTELENAAYEGNGSENMVAEKMANVLEGLDTVVLSDTKSGAFNPLDLEGLMKMFGTRAGGGAK